MFNGCCLRLNGFVFFYSSHLKILGRTTWGPHCKKHLNIYASTGIMQLPNHLLGKDALVLRLFQQEVPLDLLL